jgi:hypothetical protein
VPTEFTPGTDSRTLKFQEHHATESAPGVDAGMDLRVRFIEGKLNTHADMSSGLLAVGRRVSEKIPFQPRRTLCSSKGGIASAMERVLLSALRAENE